MAEENAIEGLLGDADESPEAEKRLGAGDPAAIAVAIDAAKYDPELARRAGDYLERQEALVRLQIKHFDEERLLAIAAAKRKRLGDFLRIGLQLFAVSAALAAALVVVSVVFDALTDHGIEIDAFAVPPDLAEKGLTGQVVAKQVFDRIGQLERDSYTVRAPNTFANNWGHDIKLEVPETGVSIGEISRWIHERLGHATRIEGDVYHDANGVTVSIRVGDEPAVNSSGAEADLKALLENAATQVYARTQPYRYGFWLGSQGRLDESRVVFRQLMIEGNAIDRVWAMHGLSNYETSPPAIIALESRALDLNPHFMIAAANVAEAERTLGHAETALTKINAVIADERGIVDDSLSTSGRAYLLYSVQVDQARLLADYSSVDTLSAAIAADTRQPFINRYRASLVETEVTILRHDPESAAWQLAMLPEVLQSARGQRAANYAQRALSEVRCELAAERGDWTAARAEIDKAEESAHGDTFRRFPRFDLPFAAALEEHTQHSAEVDAMLAAYPPDNYYAWVARARVAMLREDSAGGERALAEAVRLAPSIPLAYNELGDLYRARGDLTTAATEYREANRRGPHWADPLKAWGDILAQQGRGREALAKYDAALKVAPNWAALQKARTAAVKIAT